MNVNDIYALLNEDADNELHLREYLSEALKRQHANPENGRDIAYEIAGLLSTKYAKSLSKGSAYIQIMELAGELELPKSLQGGATWEKMHQMAETL